MFLVQHFGSFGSNQYDYENTIYYSHGTVSNSFGPYLARLRATHYLALLTQLAVAGAASLSEMHLSSLN